MVVKKSLDHLILGLLVTMMDFVVSEKYPLARTWTVRWSQNLRKQLNYPPMEESYTYHGWCISGTAFWRSLMIQRITIPYTTMESGYP